MQNSKVTQSSPHSHIHSHIAIRVLLGQCSVITLTEVQFRSMTQRAFVCIFSLASSIELCGGNNHPTLP